MTAYIATLSLFLTTLKPVLVLSSCTW